MSTELQADVVGEVVGQSSEELRDQLLAQFMECVAGKQEDSGPIVYDEIDLYAGHCQGDVKIQYLGDALLPAVKPEPTTVTYRGVPVTTEPLSLDPGGDAQSHYLLEPHRLEVYRTRGNNPLVGYFIRVPLGESLHVNHHEHADVIFKKPGWYVVRFDRDASVSDATAASTISRRID